MYYYHYTDMPFNSKYMVLNIIIIIMIHLIQHYYEYVLYLAVHSTVVKLIILCSSS